ncbi:MAG: hypothetical protein LBM13_04975 [Candidatus Ancillula sp.]|jgi:hypothetical protein|nr:hypothetical protein [Candidatus Ancillula sp.]
MKTKISKILGGMFLALLLIISLALVEVAVGYYRDSYVEQATGITIFQQANAKSKYSVGTTTKKGKVKVASCNPWSDYGSTIDNRYVSYSFKVPAFKGLSKKNASLINSKIKKYTTKALNNVVKQHKQMCQISNTTTYPGMYTVSTSYKGIYKNRYATFTIYTYTEPGVGAGACRNKYVSYTLDLKKHKFVKLSTFAKTYNGQLDGAVKYQLAKKYKSRGTRSSANPIGGNVVDFSNGIGMGSNIKAWNPTSSGIKFFTEYVAGYCASGPGNTTVKWSNIIKKTSGKTYKFTTKPMYLKGWDFQKKFKVTVKGDTVTVAECSYTPFWGIKCNKNSQYKKKYYGKRGTGKTTYVYPGTTAKKTGAGSVFKITFTSKSKRAKVKSVKEVVEDSINSYGLEDYVLL